MVADLFSVELLVLHNRYRTSKDTFQYQIMPRGSHNRRQVLLVWEDEHFNALQPIVEGKKRASDFRCTTHMTSKTSYGRGNPKLTPAQARYPTLLTPPHDNDAPPPALEPAPMILLPDWGQVKHFASQTDETEG